MALNERARDLVIAAVPWEGHAELLASLTAELAGKILVDCVNPLGFDQRGAYPLPIPLSPACAASTRAGCATAARSRR
jgi:predicted dinucleotide-binding enzyme